MLREKHSHAKPSADKSYLLAAVWRSQNVSLLDIYTGGHRSRFSGYLFRMSFIEFVGGYHEERISNRQGGGRRLLQITA